jgi:large subunit ribosomal protein L21
MYAIMEADGRQYRVSADDSLVVAKVTAEPGQTVEFDRVCLVVRDGKVTVGKPWIKGARVTCRVLGHGRGRKTDVFTYKAKENIKRKLGHRQPYTRLRVEKIAMRRSRSKQKES